MHIPQRPQNVSQLDLMKRLKAYADGDASWLPDGSRLGKNEQQASQELHANLIALVERCLHPLMDRITSREMQGFTMHDSGHGLKVAHLMWYILSPNRRDLLTPGEIALLVTTAHIHDLGMGLSENERKIRLSADSDFWDGVDPQSKYFTAMNRLADIVSKDDASPALKAEAAFQLQQAQEALLCADTRGRHATVERYNEILDCIQEFHSHDPNKIPDVETLLSFGGDSFRKKLIDICVSHNQDAHVLLEKDPTNFDQMRFPTQSPLGCCIVDTKLIAATLRIADILDFDRERTPAVLYHYLLPRSDDPSENVSVREWSKHLAISNWEITPDSIIFRGTSLSAFIHHTIVEFCRDIEEEITRTRSVFEHDEWPFITQGKVEAAIEANGYRYIPYRFSLDEQRIYELLMGENIYRERLDALREIVQNAVDACKLRDALLRCHDNSVIPTNDGRITIRYEEPNVRGSSAFLSVIDSGIGMDRYIIENYFLKVGRSYYKSNDFFRTRLLLRKREVDFNPISEFGIGLMAVFMLGDRIEVETSPSFATASDTQRRILRIDGIGKLIEVKEDMNSSFPRFQGTRVTVQLASKSAKSPIPTWDDVESYLRDICRNLDYPLHLEHITASGIEKTEILRQGLHVPVPVHLRDSAFIIDVDDADNGLRGQIVVYRAEESGAAEAALATALPITTPGRRSYIWGHGTGLLLRGGFAVGTVPGLPDFVLTPAADARIEVNRDERNPRALPVTDLARSRLVQSDSVATAILKIWLTALLEAIDDVEAKPVGSPRVIRDLIRQAKWLQRFDAFHIYRLARSCWQNALKGDGKARIENWESGEGDPLWIGNASKDTLLWALSELVLPRITTLLAGREGNFFVFPPKGDWKSKLRNWRSYVEEDVTWGSFAPYINSLRDVLCDVYLGQGFINIKYKDRLSDFGRDDFHRLFRIFDELIYAKNFGRQARISDTDHPLLERALKIAGDIPIHRISAFYTLNNLTGRG